MNKIDQFRNCTQVVSTYLLIIGLAHIAPGSLAHASSLLQCQNVFSQQMSDSIADAQAPIDAITETQPTSTTWNAIKSRWHAVNDNLKTGMNSVQVKVEDSFRNAQENATRIATTIAKVVNVKDHAIRIVNMNVLKKRISELNTFVAAMKNEKLSAFTEAIRFAELKDIFNESRQKTGAAPKLASKKVDGDTLIYKSVGENGDGGILVTGLLGSQIQFGSSDANAVLKLSLLSSHSNEIENIEVALEKNHVRTEFEERFGLTSYYGKTKEHDSIAVSIDTLGRIVELIVSPRSDLSFKNHLIAPANASRPRQLAEQSVEIQSPTPGEASNDRDSNLEVTNRNGKISVTLNGTELVFASDIPAKTNEGEVIHALTYVLPTYKTVSALPEGRTEGSQEFIYGILPRAITFHTNEKGEILKGYGVQGLTAALLPGHGLQRYLVLAASTAGHITRIVKAGLNSATNFLPAKNPKD